ncbi:hypothetical protein SAMN05421874_128100 [Nonomuraea maritima]|uniref:Uncharacterized protein n=1 Tax=Nonomuraea maritima TaxID=683260 RepID=A0A1G9MMD9_9ACTN|nr:hypothetical protein [Nonomuraea maritima]SDL75379.1 hypothetical protein SAMN05421874_128100 [Nonomuraea maritima]
MPRKKSDPRTVAFVEPGKAQAEPQAPRRPMRVREAQWTNLHTTSARLDSTTDDRLTAAVQRTGQGPQEIWEDAINFFSDRTGIPEEMPATADLKLPSPTEYRKGGQDLLQTTVRLTTNTRARLAAAASRLGLGGAETIIEALNAWFDELGIPGEYDRDKVFQRPTLYSTAAKLDEATRARVKAAAEQTGQSIQGVWETAINAYAGRHGAPKQMPEGSEVALPTPRTKKRGGDDKPTAVRLTENTRARLVAVCSRQSRTGSDVIADALTAYCDRLDIPAP